MTYSFVFTEKIDPLFLGTVIAPNPIKSLIKTALTSSRLLTVLLRSLCHPNPHKNVVGR